MVNQSWIKEVRSSFFSHIKEVQGQAAQGWQGNFTSSESISCSRMVAESPALIVTFQSVRGGRERESHSIYQSQPELSHMATSNCN